MLAKPKIDAVPWKEANLFVGVPCYGAGHPRFEESLFNFAVTSTIPLTIRKLLGSSLIPKARNQLAADFRETSCTHLLFIDSDISFAPQDVTSLVGHGVPVVGGYYARKRPGPPQWMVRTLPDEPPADPDTGLQALAGIGCGFLLIARQVFERMIDRLPFTSYVADESGRLEYDFFPAGPRADSDGTRRYFGEDFGFCALCQDLGIPVYGDPSVRLGHHGDAEYPL